MKLITDLLGDQHENTHIIGRNTKGCPHCGHKDIKIAANGKLELHHPGTECCTPRIKQQIQWRQNEINAINKKMDETIQQLNQPQDKNAKPINIHEATRQVEQRANQQIQPIAEEIAYYSNKLKRQTQ